MNKTFIGIDFKKVIFDATILFRENLNDKGIHEQFENNKTGSTGSNVGSNVK